jgi:MFS family permease
VSKIQLGLLFTIGLVFWTISNGMLPLLPVYSLQLGADVSFAGSFLSFSFLTLTISTILTGWLADKYQRRKAMFIGAGILYSLALALMSRSADQWQFAVFTSIAWFLFGMGVALVNIFAGASAGDDERGKVFGILALTGGFGLLVGGLLLGRIADTWGYPTLLLMLAVFGLLWPILGVFVKDEQVNQPAEAAEEKAARPWGSIDKGLWVFLGAWTLAWTGFFAGRLGTPLSQAPPPSQERSLYHYRRFLDGCLTRQIACELSQSDSSSVPWGWECLRSLATSGNFGWWRY